MNRLKAWFKKIVSDEAGRAIYPLAADAKALLDSRAAELFSTIESKFQQAADAALKDFCDRLTDNVLALEKEINKVLIQSPASEPSTWQVAPEGWQADEALRRSKTVLKK